MGELALGRSSKTGELIRMPQIDRFGHMMVIGPTRCGKTSKVIIPCIWQDLLDIRMKRLKYEILKMKIRKQAAERIEKFKEHLIKKYSDLDGDLKQAAIMQEMERYVDRVTRERDRKLAGLNPQQNISGLTVIEPKGDLAEEVVKMCRILDLPYKYLNPLDENTHRLNIMFGDPDVVAESNRTVLRNLFGQQEAFFAQVQETTARNTMLLLKRLRGDDLSFPDVGRALRDSKELKRLVDEYERKCTDGKGDDLSAFFRSEVFGTLKDKFYQFAMGLRQQIEDIGQNKYLQRVLVGKTDVDLDRHLEEGGILIVNTCMGVLGRLGDIFGQFVVMHLQNAVFRRPGSEKTRPYHYLWLDEAPRYINPDFERLLAIGGSFRCSVNIAIQTTGQLRYKGMESFAETVLANCRSKVIFGGLPSDDAKLFEAEFGADMKLISEYQYRYGLFAPVPALLPKAFRKKEQQKNRFDFTNIIELKSEQLKAEAIVRYYRKGVIQKPVRIITKVARCKKPLGLRWLERRYDSYIKVNRVESLSSGLENVDDNKGNIEESKVLSSVIKRNDIMESDIPELAYEFSENNCIKADASTEDNIDSAEITESESCIPVETDILKNNSKTTEQKELFIQDQPELLIKADFNIFDSSASETNRDTKSKGKKTKNTRSAQIYKWLD